MSDTHQSPRRRHILASINPEGSRKRHDETDTHGRRERKRARSETGDHKEHRKGAEAEPLKGAETEATSRPGETDQDGATDTTKPRASRLKLKDEKSRRRRSSRDRDRDRHDGESHRSHRRRHGHGRRRSPTPPNPFEPETLDPEVAFRESLFDAMADDEGASYWEGVYGQPVHVYSNAKVGEQGELEKMTDEEYAAHVRQKMWEKTNAGLLEERERRHEERKRKKEQQRHDKKMQDEMERSLRRGQERRQRRMWTRRWDEYVKGWTGWDGDAEKLPWPVESGKGSDVDEERVREFFVRGLGSEETASSTVAGRLKEERVRWHPDKMQQRLGGRVDEGIMRRVTSIFQTIDKLWGEGRGGG